MLLRLLRSSNGVDMWSVIMYILSTLLTIFLILPIHECAHALVAGKLGDKTPKRLGRVTLNPLAHIDYVGASMMLIIGFIFVNFSFKSSSESICVAGMPNANAIFFISGRVNPFSFVQPVRFPLKLPFCDW